jgi:hypothetical protein
LPSAILTGMRFWQFLWKGLFTQCRVGPNQIQIAAMLAPLVYLVLVLFSPIAYPISLVLDVIVGKDEPITTYNKLELEQLVKIQHEEITKRLTNMGVGGHGGGHGERYESLVLIRDKMCIMIRVFAALRTLLIRKK